MSRRNFGKRGGGGRRTSKRAEIPQPALLITMADRHRAMLLNISATGAMLRAENTPDVLSELFLQVGPIDVYAHVIWKRHNVCGLEFQPALDEWLVEKLRIESTSDGKAHLKPAERGGVDDWTTGVAR
jgi:hypothetical protein